MKNIIILISKCAMYYVFKFQQEVMVAHWRKNCYKIIYK